MGRICSNLYAVCKGYTKCFFMKLFHKNRIQFGKMPRLFKTAELRVSKNSFAHIGNKVSVNKGTIVSVLNGGKLEIGDHVSININSEIVCHENIKIGSNTILAPSVHIYDHDHVFGKGSGVERKKFTTEPVVIGNNCWIGVNSVILKGTTIGDNCVIAAGSVVKGNIPGNTVVVQKRETSFLNK